MYWAGEVVKVTHGFAMMKTRGEVERTCVITYTTLWTLLPPQPNKQLLNPVKHEKS